MEKKKERRNERKKERSSLGRLQIDGEESQENGLSGDSTFTLTDRFRSYLSYQLKAFTMVVNEAGRDGSKMTTS